MSLLSPGHSATLSHPPHARGSIPAAGRERPTPSLLVSHASETYPRCENPCLARPLPPSATLVRRPVVARSSTVSKPLSSPPTAPLNWAPPLTQCRQACRASMLPQSSPNGWNECLPVPRLTFLQLATRPFQTPIPAAAVIAATHRRSLRCMNTPANALRAG